MRSITTLDLQYAHRFYGFKGEAQYLHGHTGILTLEVEDTVNAGVNMVFPCNEIQKTAWEVLKNFDHATILREDDPLLPALLGVYEAQGIKDGAPNNIMKGPAFKLIIVKITFTRGVKAASEEFKPQRTMERCPLCGIALDENGVCPKCGYRK